MHSNLAFTFFTGNEDKVTEFMNDDQDYDDDELENKEGLNREMTDADGNPIRIPNREEMENIARNK